MKNKILNYDFLIIGAGLVGSLAAIALYKKNYKVLVLEKNKSLPVDNRTLAVNANSRDFLKKLGIWKDIQIEQELIDKIIIKDHINKEDLIFQDNTESLGSVIFNKSLLNISRNFLKKNKILLTGYSYKSSSLKPKKIVDLNKKNYVFKKVIISTGKNFEDLEIIKKNSFDSKHNAYVGFFRHNKNHKQIAYEIFTPAGPLAVLPAPNKQKKTSTFIFSTKKKMTFNNLSQLINKNFQVSHGKINLMPSTSCFPIRPHLSKTTQSDVLLLGDAAHSIHPVAGQGWNLGIKDIQELGLCLDNYNLDDLNFDKIYFSKRIIENISYLSFTNAINFLYESEKPFAKYIIKIIYSSLFKFSFLKKLFVRQAMGKINLV